MYDQLRSRFAWRVPAQFNIATACADRHRSDSLALIEIGPDGGRREATFGDLTELSNRFANALRGSGVEPGDRVAIVLPQSLETGVAHLALYKLGAIAVPLSGLFGPDALRYRLGDCAARLVITDTQHQDVVAGLAEELGDVGVCVVGEARAPAREFWTLLNGGSERFDPVATTADTPALIIYTSGTTGAPKGALHAHRTLLGHLPGFELSHDGFPKEGDRFWTPADWAWIGGLMDALLPAWYHGHPVVAAPRTGFDPEWAVDLMAREGVRNTFLPPTALKLIRQSDIGAASLELRSVMSGGEALGEPVLAWARERLGVTINEIYGQTEANYVVGNSASNWPVRPGSMGRPYPGHDVAVLGEDAGPAAPGEAGEVAVRVPDPVVFLEYWGKPDATREKFSGDGEWLLTGDMATVDESGYLWFVARNDDVINSAGYRIGPWEIEQCLMRHGAIVNAAVIGVPDETRGEIIKAFVKLSDRQAPSNELEADIRSLVRSQLAAYLYPREIEFVDELPMTTTGKVRRADLRRRADGRDD